MIKKGWTEEEVFEICFESERERNRRRLQAIVCDHHLKQVKYSFYTMSWQFGGERMASIE